MPASCRGMSAPVGPAGPMSSLPRAASLWSFRAGGGKLPAAPCPSWPPCRASPDSYTSWRPRTSPTWPRASSATGGDGTSRSACGCSAVTRPSSTSVRECWRRSSSRSPSRGSPGRAGSFAYATGSRSVFDSAPPTAAVGLEYYGSLGRVTHFDRSHDQQHQLFPVIDLDLGPRWEFNAGVGFEYGPPHHQDDCRLPFRLGRRHAQTAPYFWGAMVALDRHHRNRLPSPSG
jgi:hypothetical protein